MSKSSLPQIRLQRFLSDDCVTDIALNFPSNDVNLMKEVVQKVRAALLRMHGHPTLRVATLENAPIVVISILSTYPEVRAVNERLRSISTDTFELLNDSPPIDTLARAASLRMHV